MSEACDAQTNLAIQKSFLDAIWPLGFLTQVKLLADAPEGIEEPWENLAERLNSSALPYFDLFATEDRLDQLWGGFGFFERL